MSVRPSLQAAWRTVPPFCAVGRVSYSSRHVKQSQLNTSPQSKGIRGRNGRQNIVHK